jgi:hypothetical protein
MRDIELRKQCVVKVERTVFENVDFHTGENAERREPLVHLGHLDELLTEPFRAEAVCNRETR